LGPLKIIAGADVDTRGQIEWFVDNDASGGPGCETVTV
jgi:hypothetical protein